jgi:transposase-like protein
MRTKPTAHTDMNTQKKTPTTDPTEAENVGRVGKNERTRWSCNSCKVSVTLFVATPYAPTHPCPKKAGRTTQLKKEEVD